MQELAYTYTTKDDVREIYTIVEYGNPGQFDFMKNGDLVHRAAKENGKWVQIDGSDVEGEIIAALGNFMDAHHRI